MARIQWSEAEQQSVIDEAWRLRREGKLPGTSLATFHKAQRVLPKARRRPLANTGHARWFFDALKAPMSVDGPPSAEQQQSDATSAPAAPDGAPASDAGGQAGKPKVFWKDTEKQDLCTEAARLLADLRVGSARDALMRAQMHVLPPERRRPIKTMTSVADWYPVRLQAASTALRHKREAEQAAAEAPQVNTPQAEPAPAVPSTPEPVPAAAAPVAAMVVEPAAPPALASMLGRPWALLREHLVQEVADIVAEGILRGLESVRLSAPQQQTEQQEQPPRAHVPYVFEPAKQRPPSVLVVGLKGAQMSEIEADFTGKLDLRFCGADKSKDQLRAMTEQAETTVAFVDFLSHSHTDIIKARAKHYIESRGGMTTLRQQLARLAGTPTNGTAHA